MALQLTTFALATAVLLVYAVLDGADLGIGTVCPFLGRNQGQRSVLKVAAGPLWNGNEAWLLLAGTVAFAGFPGLWSIASGYFLPALLLILLALAVRAVAVELGRRESPLSAFWDATFFLGSVLPTLIAGCAVGNLIRGVHLDAQGGYAGTLGQLLNPFAVLVAFTGLVLFIMHGAAWSTIRTEGQVHNRARTVVAVASIVLMGLLAALAVVSALTLDRFTSNVVTRPTGWVSLAVLVTALVLMRLALRRHAGLLAWGSSIAVVAALAGIAVTGAYPYLVPPLGSSSGAGLTVADTAATSQTLTTLLLGALVVAAALLAYSIWAYRRSEGTATPTAQGVRLVSRRMCSQLGERRPQRSQ